MLVITQKFKKCVGGFLCTGTPFNMSNSPDWRKTLKKAMSIIDIQDISEQKGTANKITHIPKTDKWKLVTGKDHNKYCNMK